VQIQQSFAVVNREVRLRAMLEPTWNHPMMDVRLPSGTPIMITAPNRPGLRCTIIDLKNNLQKALKPGETCPIDLSREVDEPVFVALTSNPPKEPVS
jgi:hypothetical protein